MKKVFNTSIDVIHLFAQKSQDEARCNNVFFDDRNRIYSYGRHYLLAEFIKNDKGDEAIMINDTGYSVTTAKHIREITRATRQYKQFFITETSPGAVKRELNYLVGKLNKAKKPELYINPAEYLFNKFTEFQNWDGLTNDTVNLLEINSLINVFRGSSYVEYMEGKQKRIKEAERLKIKQAKKQFKKDLKDFFNYKKNYIYYRDSSLNEDFIRISQDQEFIETTQGAKVPIREAKILYLLIKAGKDIKGHKISNYTVIGLNGILRIGCHRINNKNMIETGEKIINL